MNRPFKWLAVSSSVFAAMACFAFVWDLWLEPSYDLLSAAGGMSAVAFVGGICDWWFESRRLKNSNEAPAAARVNPPFFAEWLITLLMPSRRADGLLGDLEEKFNRNVKARGLRQAQWLYLAEVLRSIFPILWTKAKKLGLIAVIAEMWRRTHS
jgi:hypothetical protein